MGEESRPGNPDFTLPETQNLLQPGFAHTDSQEAYTTAQTYLIPLSRKPQLTSRGKRTLGVCLQHTPALIAWEPEEHG